MSDEHEEYAFVEHYRSIVGAAIREERSALDGVPYPPEALADSALRCIYEHVAPRSELVQLEEERDHWKGCAVREHDLASGDAYRAIKERVLDELDKQAGASQALAVAVTLCAASEERAREAEAELTRVRGTSAPCGCSRTCGDDGDVDGSGTCKGLPW